MFGKEKEVGRREEAKGRESASIIEDIQSMCVCRADENLRKEHHASEGGETKAREHLEGIAGRTTSQHLRSIKRNLIIHNRRPPACSVLLRSKKKAVLQLERGRSNDQAPSSPLSIKAPRSPLSGPALLPANPPKNSRINRVECKKRLT